MSAGDAPQRCLAESLSLAASAEKLNENRAVAFATAKLSNVGVRSWGARLPAQSDNLELKLTAIPYEEVRGDDRAPTSSKPARGGGLLHQL